AVQYECPQPFRRAIHRGREPGGTRSDHDQVVQRLLHRPADADPVRQFAVRRVAQEQHAAAGDHRRIGLADAETLEQKVHVRIRLHVRPGEQHAVFGQEVTHAEGVGRVAGPDHPQAGEIRRRAQQLPPGDERLQDDVARGRALVQNLPQDIARHLVYFGVAAGDRADHRRIAGQMRHVAGELALAVDRDGLRVVAGIIDDFHLAGLDDEEFEVAVADREQRLPVAVRLRRDTAATAQIVDERLIEGREGDGMKIVFGHGYFTSQYEDAW